MSSSQLIFSLLKHSFFSLSQGSHKVALTFLLQTKCGLRVFLIVVPFPHKGLVHRNQLPGKLSIILINSQPAFAREKVPKTHHP